MTFLTAAFDGVTPGDADINQLRDLPDTQFADDNNAQTNNTSRAARVAKLLVAYSDDCFGKGGDEMDTILGDFMCDFRHLLDAVGVELDDVLDKSTMHYTAEIRGEF